MTKQKSFTLIELLVVIVIIGILAGVIMISTSSSIDKANFAKLKVFSESIKNDLMLNLISEWKFEEGDVGQIVSVSQVKDSWGRNNASGLYGQQVIRDNDCVSGKCLDFNGENNSINFDNKNDLMQILENHTFTYEIWANLRTYGDLVGFRGYAPKWGYSLIVTNTGTLALNYQNDADWKNIPSDFTFPKNKWNHVVLVFDYPKREALFYLNGEISPKGANYYTSSSATRFSIGQQGWSFPTGLFDEVRVYNAALSSSQIKQNYIAGLDSLLSKNLISKEEYNQRIKGLSSK